MKSKTKTVRLSEQTHHELRVRAAQSRTGINELAERFIAAGLACFPADVTTEKREN